MNSMSPRTLLRGILPPLQRSSRKHYVASVIAAIAAAILTIAIEPLFGGKAPLFIFTIAVTLAAAYGGIGPGLLATAISLGIILSILRGDVLVLLHSSWAFFAIVGSAISAVVGKLHSINAALIEAKDQLAASKDQLEATNNELASTNEKLSERTEALARSNEELQRFAYAVAHDLYSPLRTVGALTDLLMGSNAEKLDESSKECGRLVVAGVKRMESMIKGLLNYAAVLDEHVDRVTDCNHVIERVIQDLHYEIETSGALLRCDLLPAVRVNENHVAQVFLNLIGNAVKYKSARKPEIHISAKDHEDDWAFAVSDNGIGFDMRYADEIFGMFKRLHGVDDYAGSGIGLALTKAVIERHGGRIWVESEPGNGSTFFFTMPKGTGASPDALRKPAAGEPTSFRAHSASNSSD
jgi:signal transduction histidine kinase